MNDNAVSTVYGPVFSWRVGRSLGVDLILNESVCSFNCVYCQLGAIQRVTNERCLFVTTERVVEDFERSRWSESDIITFSGSGEPTLALNLGEASRALKSRCGLPQLVLTNGTRLNDPGVIEDLSGVDQVFVKLDAADEESLCRVNRPASGVTHEGILRNIEVFKRAYGGYLGLQVMMMPLNQHAFEGVLRLVGRIGPDEVQLNAPSRPYPRAWHVASRGGHSAAERPYEATPLKTLPDEWMQTAAQRLRDETGVLVKMRPGSKEEANA
ncbi:MAG: radical SAM protein [bacterium]|nr:radical SAM protein [bacterium]